MFRPLAKRWLLLGSLSSLVACGHSGGTATDAGPQDETPPAICHTPGALPSTNWFVERTHEVGLDGYLSAALASADLDGDGYPDLVSTMATDSLRDTADKHTRFLLMNRPDPADPTGRERVFVDTTAESGLLATRDGQGGRGFSIAVLGDLDNDGDVDVITCPYQGDGLGDDACTALLNDGTAHFALAPPGELEDVGPQQSVSAALLDYDRDGVLDLWPANGETYAGYHPVLFHGLGDGRFHEVAEAMGLPQEGGDPALSQSYRRTFGVTACDLDGDGDQDVLLAAYGREANQVWRNDGDHFTEVGQELGVAWDARMDYAVDDQSYLCWCQANDGMCAMDTPAPLAGICPDRGWAPGESDQPWRLGGNTFSIACGDIDDDGDMDLMTAEIRHWDVGADADPSELLLNETPPGQALMKFVRPGNDATGLDRHERGDWNEGDMMPVFADVDLDGRKDIYLTSSDYPGDHGWLWRQKGDGTFEDVTAASGAGMPSIHGVALIDYDRDGDLDLIGGTSTARGVAPTAALRVFRNELPRDRNWLQVRLVGLGAGHANVSGIGARVRVTTAEGRTQSQEVSGGYGHSAMHHGSVLTFGLGAACAAEVEVRWPDAAGTVERFGTVQGNYRVELHEGSGHVHYLVDE